MGYVVQGAEIATDADGYLLEADSATRWSR